MANATFIALFTTAGTSAWIPPSGTSAVSTECWAAGGGGSWTAAAGPGWTSAEAGQRVPPAAPRARAVTAISRISSLISHPVTGDGPRMVLCPTRRARVVVGRNGDGREHDVRAGLVLEPAVRSRAHGLGGGPAAHYT